MISLAELVSGELTWMPHGQCYLWQPGVLWLNVLSDLLIALAYFSLAAALIYLVAKRRDLAFKPIFIMFGIFILACGVTYVMNAITVWVPAYWLSGGLKALTAAVSVIWSVVVWYYLPRTLALPSRDRLHEINTELEQLNRQLHDEVINRTETEQQFRALLESAPDAIVIVDQDGRIALVNSQTEKWFGYQRDELLGQPIEKLMPQRFRDRHVSTRDAYINNPTLRPMGAGLELYGARKDGSEFPVEISLSPLQTAGKSLTTSVIRDITARKQMEQIQLQVQSRYRDLVTNLPVGVYRETLGEQGGFLEVNPSLVEILEAQSTEALQQHSVRDLFPEPSAYDAFLEKLTRQGRVNGEEIHLKTLKGREFDAAVTAILKLDDKLGGYVDGVLEDITPRKENELHIRELNDSLSKRTTELEHINGELEAFSYSVSHDLRAPLRAIDGFSRILLRDNSTQLDDKGRGLLDRVRNAAQQMATLIDDLLNLSRISRAELNYEPVDLAALAGKVMDNLRQADPERSVQFRIEPGELVTQGDPRLLRVVMDNLLGNAWKFTSQRPDALIELGVEYQQDTPVYFVRDNGAGFDMAYSNKLFGAFQRLHDANTFSGTGIGLATVQRIIHKHHGQIWAHGQEGEGASFFFTVNQDVRHEG
jgi:PAS domain S-box-containing protein